MVWFEGDISQIAQADARSWIHKLEVTPLDAPQQVILEVLLLLLLLVLEPAGVDFDARFWLVSCRFTFLSLLLAFIFRGRSVAVVLIAVVTCVAHVDLVKLRHTLGAPWISSFQAIQFGDILQLQL